MAHYAKISNDEFTVSERARLIEAEAEKSVLKLTTREVKNMQHLKQPIMIHLPQRLCKLLRARWLNCSTADTRHDTRGKRSP